MSQVVIGASTDRAAHRKLDYRVHRRPSPLWGNGGFRRKPGTPMCRVEGPAADRWPSAGRQSRRPYLASSRREEPSRARLVAALICNLRLMTLLQRIGPGSPFANGRETFRKSGTDGSNPVPSTGESRANLTSSIRAPKLRSATACSLASLRRSVRHADFAGAKRASNFLEEVSAPGRRSRSLAVLCIHLEPRACLLLEGDQGFEFPPSESKSCRRWAI